MSLIISVYTHEGIVMATDSRLTLNAKVQQADKLVDISFDFSNSTTKLFCAKNGIAVSTCGDAGIGATPIAGYVENFMTLHENERVEVFAAKLLEHFRGLSQPLKTIFHVGGYTGDGKQKLFHVSTAQNTVSEINPKGLQGVKWDGETDILTRLVSPTWVGDSKGEPTIKLPIYPIPWEFFSLQDAIDFALFSMNATIGAIRFQNRIKTVGGPVDLLVVKPKQTVWVQQKQLHC